MPRLSQRKQRMLCRVIFVITCVIPTLAVGWHAGRWLLPGRATRVAAQLAAVLDTTVTVGRVRALRPNVMRIDHVELRDQESGDVFAVAQQLEVDVWGTHLSAMAEQVTLNWTQRVAAMQWLQRWVRRDQPRHFLLRAQRATTVEAAQENAATPRAMWDLEQPMLELTSRQMGKAIQGRVVTIRGANGDGGANIPFRWRLERNRQTSPPSSRVELQTGSHRIPLRMLASSIPLADRCGWAAMFEGECSLSVGNGAATGQAAGLFEPVALTNLLGPASPHRISGHGMIHWHHLHWNQGRIISGQGRITATNGQIGRSLLDAAVTRLAFQLVVPISVHDSSTPVAFDQLALKFALSSSGLTIWGDCPTGLNNAPSGVLIRDATPLVLQPPYVDIPLSWLVAALTTPIGESLPATLEAEEFARWLPLPNAETAISRRRRGEGNR